jgi:preprotein translocase subunit YajC
LIDQKGKAVAGMDAQSATHVAIIVLVIICNLFYFSMRRAARQQSQAR